MKIAMLTSWQEACGIADYAGALVAALKSRVELEVIPLKHGQTDPAYFRGLADQCNAFDLVHIQHEYVFFGKRWPGQHRWHDLVANLRVPYVVTAHTWLRPTSGGRGWKPWARWLRDGLVRAIGWSRYLEAGQFRTARRVIVHTDAHREFLIRQGLLPEQVSVLPQGVPESFPQGVGERARTRWQLTGPVVTLFGFLNPAKGHALALEAWDQLTVGATLVIAGKAFSERDAAYAQTIEHEAKRRGSAVRWLGYLPEAELADLLDASDVVVMPYVHTTSSYALSLALAQGCTVLASDLEPFQEICAERACLALFHRGDSADLGRALTRLLGHPQERRRLQKAALTWAREHSWTNVAEKTLQVYTSL